MEKIKVSICTGTACYVMGASEILLLEENLPQDLKDKVEIEGITCLDECRNNKGKKPPYVKIGDELLDNANIQSVIEKIYSIINKA